MPSGKLKIDIRREKILELLKQEGQVTVLELSKTLGATPVTIRNDLDSLAQDGRLERIQGGAVAISATTSPWMDYNTKGMAVCAAEKRAIAHCILTKIHDGDTLFINSGTTTLTVAEVLSRHKRINVVTNSLSVAQLLAHSVTSRVVLLGGELNSDYGFTYGGDAIEQLRRYQPTWSILSVDGVDPDGGITTYHAEEVMIDRMMMERAHRTMIASDHRKIGCAGFTRICGIDRRHTLVTDSGCETAALERIRATGAEVCVASMSFPRCNR